MQTGLIVATGPGTPVADLSSLDDEPWKVDSREGKSRAMQARVGDHATFFRKAAVEITFEEKKLPRRAPGSDPGAGPGRPAHLRSRAGATFVCYHLRIASPLTLSEVRSMLPDGITADALPSTELTGFRVLLPTAQTAAHLRVGRAPATWSGRACPMPGRMSGISAPATRHWPLARPDHP